MKFNYDYWLITEVQAGLIALIIREIKIPLRLWKKCGGFNYKKLIHISKNVNTAVINGKHYLEWYEIPIKYYLN
jgi:hypothetical protein